MSLTEYDLTDAIATITMNDGKVNALSSAMLGEISAALDRSEADGAEAVVLSGGTGSTFSAGFDLRTEPDGWPPMLVAGAGLAHKLLGFPLPTVAACNGNALAMAGFLLLSTDYRVGARGEFRIGLNEVRIGLTVPWFGIEIARHRLARPQFDRCTITGAILGPEEARDAGFLDELVEPDEVLTAARRAAEDLKQVKPDAHAATKLRVRDQVRAGIRESIETIEAGGDPRDW